MSVADKELSRRFTELFSTGDHALADEVLGEDVVVHLGEQELRGIEQVKGLVAGYRAAFPDARSTVEDQIAEEGKVATRWRSRGTHRGNLGDLRPTGREFAIDGVTIERISGGKIVEVWVVRDELGLMRQLGALAQPPAAEARVPGR